MARILIDDPLRSGRGKCRGGCGAARSRHQGVCVDLIARSERQRSSP